MTDQPCAGPCNSRARRLWSAYEAAVAAWQQAPRGVRGVPPAEPTVGVVYGEPVFCLKCVDLIRSDLAELPAMAGARHEGMDGFQAPMRTPDRVATTKTAPSPSPGHDDLDELVRWLQDTEDAYRAYHDWSPAGRGRPDLCTLENLVGWFGNHLDRILIVATLGDQFGLGVLRWHARLQHQTAVRPARRHKPLPCPRCARFSLFLEHDGAVRCHGEDPDCGRLLTREEYSLLEERAAGQIAS